MWDLFLKQLAVIGALSAVVLAVLWQHARPLFQSIWAYIISKFISRLLGHNHLLSEGEDGHLSSEDIAQRRSIIDHPRLGGHSLKRTVPGTVVQQSAKISLAGYGSSPLAATLRHQTLGGTGANQSASQSSMSLTLFTAAVIALIIFSIMKVLSAKFATGKGNLTRHAVGRGARTCETDGDDESDSGSQKVCHGGRTKVGSRKRTDRLDDLGLDRRKLSRLSRDERTRLLILRHGGRNITKAIRFLISELEKQKLDLLTGDGAQQIATNDSIETTGHERCECKCACHNPIDREPSASGDSLPGEEGQALREPI